MRGHEVLQDTAPSAVSQSAAGLRLRIALLSRQPKPSHRFPVVLYYPLALGIHDTESGLRTRDALLYCEPVQLGRLGLVLLSTSGAFVEGLAHASLWNMLLVVKGRGL